MEVEFAMTKNHFQNRMDELSGPLRYLRVKLKNECPVAESLREVKAVYKLKQQDLLDIGWIYNEWNKRTSNNAK